jgi:hypothetical protein
MSPVAVVAAIAASCGHDVHAVLDLQLLQLLP